MELSNNLIDGISPSINVPVSRVPLKLRYSCQGACNPSVRQDEQCGAELTLDDLAEDAGSRHLELGYWDGLEEHHVNAAEGAPMGRLTE